MGSVIPYYNIIIQKFDARPWLHTHKNDEIGNQKNRLRRTGGERFPFPKVDLCNLIEERDRKIRKLQHKIERLEKEKQEYLKSSFRNHSETDRMNFFKEKIGE